MKTQQIDRDCLDIFLRGWGHMGTRWGVGKVMAEIQALLYLSPGPMGLDDMADTLKTSRSNVSMNVRALQDLGVVRKIIVQGDRKDYYVTEEDVATVARRLAAAKKKRELDPALDIINEAIQAAESSKPDSKGAAAQAHVTMRLRELKQLLVSIDSVFAQFTGDGDH
jgi:DNA-binding transcriptional regulator GbsR (MarR family)